MLFNTIEFLLFFPAVTLLFYLLPQRWRWLMLLAASCFFYMWFIPKYIFILLVTIVIDYTAGILIERWADSPKRKRGALVTSIVSTCLVLFIFKYLNFCSANLVAVAQHLVWAHPSHVLNIVLPIGLSFHTFQSLSYVIEVYRGNQRAEHHFGYYSLYVMFYPQLVTGPIERPQNLLRQLRIPQAFQAENLSRGVMLILFGLFAKMVVADNLAVYVDQIYAQPDQFGAAAIALGMVAYSFQIYCDFFGYSTIALGCAKAMGYDLMDNFRAPYLSTSVGEFWHRWHISLSSWFRDYLYIPLGGSRVRLSRWMLNIMVVFLLSGLWHGASWTFMVWGGLHGLMLLAEGLPHKLRKTKPLPAEQLSPMVRVLKTAGVFVVVTLLWTLFRAEGFWQLRQLYDAFFHNFGQTVMPDFEWRTLIFLFLFIVADYLLRNTRFDRWCVSQRPFVQWGLCFLLAFGIIAFASVEIFPFIYFQF